jgi:hypothetical protein
MLKEMGVNHEISSLPLMFESLTLATAEISDKDLNK